MSSKRLRCRIGLHAWRIKHNEEDGAPYQECVRSFEQRDVPSVHWAGGMAGMPGGM